MTDSHYLDTIRNLAASDAFAAERGFAKYGDSCLKRGGAGLFFMLARKMDRVEHTAKEHGYDLFAALAANPGPTGLLDDIQDLRVYLLIAEAEFRRTMVPVCDDEEKLCVEANDEPVVE